MTPFECISLRDGTPVPIPEALVLCLGKFDGVHLAHRRLLSHAKKLRDSRFPSAVCGVFCFSRLPLDSLSKNPPAHLCTLEQKLAAFYEEGMEVAILADFDSLRELSPEVFVQTILKEGCNTVAAVCGFNYRFGKNGAGNAALLCKLLGNVEVQEEVKLDGETVSSSRIRALLQNGDVALAAKLLTHPYTLSVPVVHGKALGRTWGIPTVNQNFPHALLIPMHGVYLTECRVEDRKYCGISNVGVRPTVENDTIANCETYLLDFDGDLYGKKLSVSFLELLRPEIKFSSKEELTAQIQQDIATAKKHLQN